MPELTTKRTVASIPFCGRYRLIDFALSNMVNSGITKVGLITKSNFQSLMDHVGSGKDWDLARHQGGLFILPPFGVQESNSLYSTRLEALKNTTGFLIKSTEEFVVLSDSDMVCNIDFKPIIKNHITNNSDITLVYVKCDGGKLSGNNSCALKLNASGRVTDMLLDPKTAGKVNGYINVLVISRIMLINMINEAVSQGKKHFLSEVLLENIKDLRIFGYEHTGHFEELTSLQSYYDENMRFLDKKIRDEIFRTVNVFTKIKDSAPTKYGENAIVKNSLVADGCQIEGEVYNSIIFRGVKIGRGTVIKNSILMQNTMTGENVSLNCMITDKNVIIKDKRVLSGCETHPIFIGKNVVI